MKPDLSTNIAGLRLKNPLMSSASEFARDGEAIKEISEKGVPAVVTKTIVKQPVPHVRPCYYKFDGGFLNCVSGSDLSSEQWFEEEFEVAKEADAKLIASIAGTSPEESVELAKNAVEAGADAIEHPTLCPHTAELYSEIFGADIKAPMVDNPIPYAEIMDKITDEVDIPVISKLSAVFFPEAVEWAEAVEDAGVDAISAVDALGPAMEIDVDTGQPVLGGPMGNGGLTGSAIRTISLKMIYDISEAVDIPVIGVGGVNNGEDVLKYLMAGASGVGITSAIHLGSLDKIGVILDEISNFMEEKGIDSLEDMIGKTHERVRERREQEKVLITEPKVPTIDKETCTGCGFCEKACVYGAMSVDDVAEVDPEKCFGCRLCVSVCPVDAITLEYY